MIKATLTTPDDTLVEFIDPSSSKLTEGELLTKLQEAELDTPDASWSFEFSEPWNAASFIEEVVGYGLSHDEIEELIPGTHKLMEEVA